MGLLAPVLQTKIGWNEIQYGYIVTAFQAAYAMGLLFMGGLIDRVGTRIGYAIAIGVWSVSAMAHSLVRTAIGFGIARFALGLGESGNFPAAIKTVAEWFPRKERALATGIFNAGANLGAIIAPLVVPWVTLRYGWPYAFLFTGIFSAIWIMVWWLTYRPPAIHDRLSPRELAYIRSDPQASITKIPWLRLLPHRQTWAFILGKFLTDPVWWFYLYWIPKFLNEKHGLTLNKLGPPLVLIYVMADVGSVGGGWLSGAFPQARMEREPGPQDRHADLCALHGTHDFCLGCLGNLASGGAVGISQRGASGLVGEYLHAGVGHVSPACGGVGGRHWRIRRRGGRNADRDFHRLPVADDRQLPGSLPDCKFSLSASSTHHSPAGAPA